VSRPVIESTEVRREPGAGEVVFGGEMVRIWRRAPLKEAQEWDLGIPQVFLCPFGSPWW
jgi:hypothetical protein